MKVRNFLLALSVAATVPTVAQAVDVAYQGVLVSGVPVASDAGGYSWFLDDGANVDFWRFDANAGDQVTLRVDRLNANFDPALSLYAGLTSSDTSLFSSTGDWGGLTYVGSLDDENPPSLLPAGPNGDPSGAFSVASTGWYTVAVGGSNSTDSGPYPYQITWTVSAVPEPVRLALFAAGLVGINFARRRAKNRPGDTD